MQRHSTPLEKEPAIHMAKKQNGYITVEQLQLGVDADSRGMNHLQARSMSERRRKGHPIALDLFLRYRCLTLSSMHGCNGIEVMFPLLLPYRCVAVAILRLQFGCVRESIGCAAGSVERPNFMLFVLFKLSSPFHAIQPVDSCVLVRKIL